MYYLDTSLLISAWTIEAETERVQAWLREDEHAEVATSDWVETEFAAALSRKIRMKLITAGERDRAMRTLFEMKQATFETLAITRGHFHAATRLVTNAASGLRGADALHLAIADAHAAVLCTLDRRQAEAGQALGIATILL